MRFRRSGIVVGIGILVVGGGLAALLGPDGDGPESGSSPRFGGSLQREGAEMVDLLVKSRTATYYARYRASGSSDALGGVFNMELWRRGEDVRQDVELHVGKKTVRAAAIQRSDGAYRCQKEDETAWTCAESPGVAPGLDQLLGQLEQDLSESTVEARNTSLRGRKVRCFTATSAGEAREFCATAAGVPVLIAAPGARLELVEYADDVPENIFTLPARST